MLDRTSFFLIYGLQPNTKRALTRSFPSTPAFAPEPEFLTILFVWRGQESNPCLPAGRCMSLRTSRYGGGYRIRTCGGYSPTGFQDQRHKPLGQPSALSGFLTPSKTGRHSEHLSNVQIITKIGHLDWVRDKIFVTISGFAWIAQLVEHPLGKGKVKDSNSFPGSLFSSCVLR